MGVGLRTPGSAGPLTGRTIVITRAVEQSSSLTGPLEALGAEVLVMPVIEVAPPEDWAEADRAIEDLDRYDWIVLTSTNGVDAFDARLRLHGLRIADLDAAKVAAVGSATAAHLHALGVEPAVVPGSFRAEGLIEEFARIGAAQGPRVLIPRASEAREVLPDELRALGFEVDVVPIYRLVTVRPSIEMLERLSSGTVDAVVFASGGTARRFAEVLTAEGMDAAGLLVGPVVTSIGPVTTDALHELGIAVDAQACEATSAGIIDALVKRLGDGS